MDHGAHVGHSGNEHADSLAKLGCFGVLPEEETPQPRRLVRNTVVSRIRELWEQEWQNYPFGRQTKFFCVGLEPSRAKEVRQLSRFALGRLIRLVTGHNGFNVHRHNVDNEVPDTCRLCRDGVESFLHFISDCPALVRERDEIFSRSFQRRGDWCVDEVLAFSRIPRISGYMDQHGFYSDERGQPTPGESSESSSSDSD